ncbi:MAG: helix-turn-helix domain-containing protein [Acidimicrobiia bacterium]
MTTSPRIAARRAATRAEILEAAWRLAREHGIAGFSLRDLAREVGMQAPSLYAHFDGKDAIYDAMFEQGNRQLLDFMGDLEPTGDLRALLVEGARGFLAFCTEDDARFQLLFGRPIPGWEPSPEAYAPAVEALERNRAVFEAVGLGQPEHLDLWTAVTSGLAHQQLANDPGGDRWTRLVDDAVDMYLAHVTKEHP